MNQLFQYAILKYRPSYLLDERANIGLLFKFENIPSLNNHKNDSNRFIFVYPNRLGRISSFFPDLGKDNLTDIKLYLRSFNKVANKLSYSEKVNGKTLKELISTEFIINDANSLFFSDVKEGSYTSIDSTVEFYEDQFFKFYDRTKSKKSTDAVVKAAFQKSLIELSSEKDIRLGYFKEGVNIENKITTSKFEYRWQNGTPNLIKTLGFDLSDKQDIQDKAFKWTSAINYIHQIGKYKDYNFDVLVSRPKDKNLFAAYDNALEVLSDIKANKEIYEEDKIKQYAEKALNSVRPFEE